MYYSQVLDFFLVVVIITLFVYKRYVDNRLRNKPSPWNFVGSFNPQAPFYTLFPNRKERYGAERHNLVEKGNLALLVFYIFFGLLLVRVLLGVLVWMRTTHAFAIQAKEYVLTKRITILLQETNEPVEYKIPVLHKAYLR